MSVNKVILLGNLTKNAEVRTVGQSQVASFGLAMNERRKNPDGSTTERTEFADIELWNNAGVYPYLQKGQQVYIEGSLNTQTWTGQDGSQHKAVRIRAGRVELLGSRPQQQQQPQQQQGFQQPQYGQPYAPQPQPQYNAYPQYQQPPVPPTPPTQQPPFPQQPYPQQSAPQPQPATPVGPAPAPAPAQPVQTTQEDNDLPF